MSQAFGPDYRVNPRAITRSSFSKLFSKRVPERQSYQQQRRSPEFIPPEPEDTEFAPLDDDPSQYPEGSPEWNMAMIRLLLDLKTKGHRISEFRTNQVRSFPKVAKNVTDKVLKQKSVRGKRQRLRDDRKLVISTRSEVLSMCTLN